MPIRNSSPSCSSDLAMTFSIVPLESSLARSSTLVLFSLNRLICASRRVTSARCSSVSCPDCQRESCSSKSQKSLRGVVNTCLIRLTVKSSRTCGLPLARFSVSYCSTSASSIPSICVASVGNKLIGCHCGCCWPGCRGRFFLDMTSSLSPHQLLTSIKRSRQENERGGTIDLSLLLLSTPGDCMLKDAS